MQRRNPCIDFFCWGLTLRDFESEWFPMRKKWKEFPCESCVTHMSPRQLAVLATSLGAQRELAWCRWWNTFPSRWRPQDSSVKYAEPEALSLSLLSRLTANSNEYWEGGWYSWADHLKLKGSAVPWVPPRAALSAKPWKRRALALESVCFVWRSFDQESRRRILKLVILLFYEAAVDLLNKLYTAQCMKIDCATAF